ncbi:hypothetical protein Scep_020213 [Stephania cephalantha]|uniref:Uncharacterized protein n=1 Tax=Stephania cephalantha TaxID=152367 RepID=A0AAP0IC87_9MAGN
MGKSGELKWVGVGFGDCEVGLEIGMDLVVVVSAERERRVGWCCVVFMCRDSREHPQVWR